MADVLAFRCAPPRGSQASLSTLRVTTFCMIAQMVGAGTLVAFLLNGSGHLQRGRHRRGRPDGRVRGLRRNAGHHWVQIIKAILLMSGTIFLSVLVLGHYGFSFARFFDAVSHITYQDPKTHAEVTRKLFGARTALHHPERLGLDLAWAGPGVWNRGAAHILVRFYTVPDAKTARISVVWAMVIIGTFYILTTFLGFRAAAILGPTTTIPAESTWCAPARSGAGGEGFLRVYYGFAFATILAVVAGLTISACTSLSHDLYTNVIHNGRNAPRERKCGWRESPLSLLLRCRFLSRFYWDPV